MSDTCRKYFTAIGIILGILSYIAFIAALIIGPIKIHKCPGEPRLPIWLIILGIVGFAFGTFVIIYKVSNS